MIGWHNNYLVFWWYFRRLYILSVADILIYQQKSSQRLHTDNRLLIELAYYLLTA